MKPGFDFSLDFKNYITSLLSDLINIPTINPPGENYEECTNYLADKLSGLGLDVRIIEIPEKYLDKHYPYSPKHRGYPRYIVLAKMGRGKPVLHFNGHYDVVPPGIGWNRDPFTPIIEGDKIYGRGSTDMKGGIASILGAIKWIIEEGVKIKGTLEVAFVPDEEAGGIGTRYLIEEKYAKAKYVIIGEPTTLERIIIGHKGLVRGIVRVIGKQVHGSTPWHGENAFLKAALLVLKFMELYDPLLKSRKTKYPVREPEGAYPTINLGGFAESLSKKDNIVPGEFVFSFDRRVIPEEDINEVIEELKSYFNKASKATNVKHEIKITSAIPPSTTPMESLIVAIAKNCLKKCLNITPKIEISFGRNDAVYYTNILQSQVICLGPGVENVAHAPNEYNEISQIIKITKVYRCIIEEILGK